VAAAIADFAALELFHLRRFKEVLGSMKVLF